MLFNSLEFLIFLPAVFLIYWFVVGKNLRAQNLFVLAASYLFYGWWSWKPLLLIALTSALSFGSGLIINKLRESNGGGYLRHLKWVNIANIVINLSILGLFKYYNFFVESFSAAMSSIGIETGWVTLNLVLPVGVSFYTFQALSYSIDVYNEKIKPTHDAVAFFAYVSFFPQLVAGPIERATNLLPQFEKPRTFDYSKAVDGCRQMLWGFFKKIVIADNCATLANNAFADYAELPASALWLGAIFFTIQIYCDFSGYSDIAIGASRLFGINLRRNFNFPYFSRDIAEFWRRWHISLTTWFRDYVYIPLGGSREGRAKALRNTFIIFALSGLWHGANWTFVAWGLYHAVLFIPLLLLGRNRRNTDIVAQGRILPSIKEFGQMFMTLILVIIGWVIFRAESITEAWGYICGMFDGSVLTPPPASFKWLYYRNVIVYLCVVILFGVEWLQREQEHGLQFNNRMRLFGLPNKRIVRGVIYLIILLLISQYMWGVSAEFIYFQF